MTQLTARQDGGKETLRWRQLVPVSVQFTSASYLLLQTLMCYEESTDNKTYDFSTDFLQNWNNFEEQLFSWVITGTVTKYKINYQKEGFLSH